MEDLHMIDINDLPQFVSDIDEDNITLEPMTRFPGTEPNFWLRYHIAQKIISVKENENN